MENTSAPLERPPPKRKLAAILSADVVGYSRLMGDDDRAALDTLTTYRQVRRDRISEHGGRELCSSAFSAHTP
jgi:class 3 adenylate cyclase